MGVAPSFAPRAPSQEASSGASAALDGITMSTLEDEAYGVHMGGMPHYRSPNVLTTGLNPRTEPFCETLLRTPNSSLTPRDSIPSDLCLPAAPAGSCRHPSWTEKVSQSRQSKAAPDFVRMMASLTDHHTTDPFSSGSKFVSAATHPHADEESMASTPLGAWSGRVGSPTRSPAGEKHRAGTATHIQI